MHDMSMTRFELLAEHARVTTALGHAIVDGDGVWVVVQCLALTAVEARLLVLDKGVHVAIVTLCIGRIG